VIAPEAPAARLIAASNPADQRTWTMDDLDLLRAASLGPAVIHMNLPMAGATPKASHKRINLASLL
jgi:hypothetical protein